jgi:hypothetical protein
MVGVGTIVGVVVGVGVGDGESVGRGVGTGVGFGVGTGVGFGVGTGVGVGASRAWHAKQDVFPESGCGAGGAGATQAPQSGIAWAVVANDDAASTDAASKANRMRLRAAEASLPMDEVVRLSAQLLLLLIFPGSPVR